MAALVVTDALTRLQSGALGDENAPDRDTFEDDLLEYPHYTRPRDYRGWSAPDVLLSGNHAVIERWRLWHQLRATQARRPDLFARRPVTAAEAVLLASEEPMAPPNSRPAPRPGSAAETEIEPCDNRKEQEETDGTGT